MRRALVLVALFALLLSPPPGLAVTPLEAAVAPGQVVVDAAAIVLREATREADRDGTPDVAYALLGDLRRFVSDFATPVIPPEASYAGETLASLSFATEVASRLERVPDAVGGISRILHRCDVEDITPVEYQELSQHLGVLTGRLETLAVLAASAPAGIRTHDLDRAVQSTRAWLANERESRECKIAEEFIVVRVEVIPENPDITFALFPTVAWPTANVSITGRSTNATAPVRLMASFIGLDVTLPVDARGAFTHTITLPETTPLGPQTLVLTQGALSAERALTIVRAPSRLDVIGPTRAFVNETITYEVRLTSVLPDRTRDATIQVRPGDEVTLREGRVNVSFQTPQVRGDLAVRFTYPGDEIVASSERLLVVSIVPTLPPPPPVLETDRLDWWILAGIAVLVVAASVANVWRARREARPQPPAHGRFAHAIATLAAPSHLVGLVAWIMTWLRGRGFVRPGTTVREAGPVMVEHGLGGGALVRAFERLRYGPKRESRLDAAQLAEWRTRATAVLGSDPEGRA